MSHHQPPMKSGNNVANSNFVLKLSVMEQKDGKVFGIGSHSNKMHRVRLSHIHDVEGQVSYKCLAEYVVRYTVPDPNVISEDYDVVCTYYDIDNDCITISSSEELIDAIGQFSSKASNSCLRITANVARKKRPFLHCLHTCDGCKCSPIIGIRYHARNMPDLDFCSTCREKYQGTDIYFQVEELERDRPWQNLWHQKWAEINSDDLTARQWARLSDDSSVKISSTSATVDKSSKESSKSFLGIKLPSAIAA